MGGSRKANIERGDGLDRGAWTICRFKWGGLGRKTGGVFEGVGGGGIPVHTMCEKVITSQ